MSQNIETLNTVLANIKLNRDQIATQLVASTKALGDATPEVLSAIDLLIETYGPNVQVIGQTVGAKLQIQQLEKTSVEINALIAGLEIVVNDTDADAKLTQQMSADIIREAANS